MMGSSAASSLELLTDSGDGQFVTVLPPRQRQILQMLLEGNSEKQIAGMLSISVHTVHIHVMTLYRRFNVHSRAELLGRFLRLLGEQVASTRPLV